MEKIINVNKIEKLLADENVSAYGIEKVTGVSRDTISKIRRGQSDLENLSIKNALKLMKYVKMEENTVKVTKIELKEARVEVKKNEIHEGCTQEHGDICADTLKEFDNLEDAKKELENYQSSVYDLRNGKFEVTEYYIEVSRYDEIDGEPVGVIDSEAYFAKGDYHTEHKFLGDFGDYYLTKMDNDILVEFHENVNRKNVVKYLPDYDLDTFEELVEEYEDADDMDERESKLFAINDLLGI
ncbi:hypothetical protein [Enterococcus cecorum]|uniref:hypothetical protein n=1 Tax=Enterococcus cecorum TaxID=44008 RepID=UPI0032C419EE